MIIIYIFTHDILSVCWERIATETIIYVCDNTEIPVEQALDPDKKLQIQPPYMLFGKSTAITRDAEDLSEQVDIADSPFTAMEVFERGGTKLSETAQGSVARMLCILFKRCSDPDFIPAAESSHYLRIRRRALGGAPEPTEMFALAGRVGEPDIFAKMRRLVEEAELNQKIDNLEQWVQQLERRLQDIDYFDDDEGDEV